MIYFPFLVAFSMIALSILDDTPIEPPEPDDCDDRIDDLLIDPDDHFCGTDEDDTITGTAGQFAGFGEGGDDVIRKQKTHFQPLRRHLLSSLTSATISCSAIPVTTIFWQMPALIRSLVGSAKTLLPHWDLGQTHLAKVITTPFMPMVAPMVVTVMML